MRRRIAFGELEQPGDYVALPDKGIVLICPRCGNWIEVGGPNCYPHVIVAIEPLSIVPSVVCPWQQCHYVVAQGRC